jgi:hypothetical protein
MTEVHRPIDVLEVQVGLIRFWASHDALVLSEGYANLTRRALGPNPPPLSKVLSPRLDASETFYVRSHIQSRLWSWAADVEPHHAETVERADLPCPNGFAWLEQTLYVPDVYGDTMTVKALSWSEEANGVLLVTWSDPKDPADDVNRFYRDNPHAPDLERLTGSPFTAQPLQVMHMTPWAWGSRVLNLAPEDVSAEATTEDLYGKWTGTTEERSRRRLEAHAENVASVSRLNHFVLMLWEFVQEQAPLPMRADRPMRRRLAREGSPLSEVLVVDLRPYPNRAEKNPDPEPIWYSHRFPVREHKRRWIDKHGNHRETTVHAYVKGDPSLPLIEKDRVYHVRR